MTQISGKLHKKVASNSHSMIDNCACIRSTNGNPTMCHIKVTINITVYGKTFHWKRFTIFMVFHPTTIFLTNY